MTPSPVRLWLFLDFDGVLHHFFPVPGSSDAANQHFAFLPTFEDAVREVASQCTVGIVISSSWRRQRTVAALRSLFSPDIAALVHDKTPMVGSGQDAGGRQVEVEAWLRANGQEGVAWIGIDDMPELFRPGAAVVACPDGFFDDQRRALVEAAADPRAWAQRHPVPAQALAPGSEACEGGGAVARCPFSRTEASVDLNPQQQQAVQVDHTHVWVVAGAGSGKTRVLTERIARLVREGGEARRIRAVTFTNKAAREMKERLERALGSQAHGLSVGTFHGLAHRWLRRHADRAGLPEGFVLLDDDDQHRLVKQIIKDQEWDEKEWSPRAGVAWMSRKKDDGLRAIAIRPQSFEDRRWHQLYTLYEERCKQLDAVDFGELLLRTLETLRDHPDLAEAEQNRYDHIMVDEFQDTNAVQYELLRLWVRPGSWFFAVGDADQAIYGWRGARTDNIDRMKVDFSPVTTVVLDQNYRSTQSILSAANQIICRNTGREDKRLWTQAGPGNAVRVCTVTDEVDEAKVIGVMAREWVGRGYLPERFAVLYRNNAQSRAIEEQLMAHRLPYTIYGGQRFFDRKEVKDAMAYVRLAANRADDLAFQRVFNTPTRGLGATVESALALQAVASGSLWQAAQDLLSAQKLPLRAATSLRAFMDTVETIDNQPSLMAATDVAVSGSGLRAWYAKDKNAQEEGRLENLDELVSVASRYSQNSPTSTLAGFVADAVLEHEESQNGQGIQLMTIHAAKGLEFSWVCLPGWENGVFPTARSLEEGTLDEERRLAYVAITRAEHQAVVLHAARRRWYGRYVDQTPSMFLLDLPREEVHHQWSPMAQSRAIPHPWRHRR